MRFYACCHTFAQAAVRGAGGRARSAGYGKQFKAATCLFGYSRFGKATTKVHGSAAYKYAEDPMLRCVTRSLPSSAGIV